MPHMKRGWDFFLFRLREVFVAIIDFMANYLAFGSAELSWTTFRASYARLSCLAEEGATERK